jgi:hypothetical protein
MGNTTRTRNAENTLNARYEAEDRIYAALDDLNAAVKAGKSYGEALTRIAEKAGVLVADLAFAYDSQ